MLGRPEAVDDLRWRCRPEGAFLVQIRFGGIASEAFANAGLSSCLSCTARLLELPEVVDDLSWRSRPEGALLVHTGHEQCERPEGGLQEAQKSLSARYGRLEA